MTTPFRPTKSVSTDRMVLSDALPLSHTVVALTRYQRQSGVKNSLMRRCGFSRTVPESIKVSSGDVIRAVSFDKATHVYAYSEETNIIGQFETRFTWYGATFMGLSIATGSQRHYYVDLDQSFKTRTTEPLAHIAALYSGLDTIAERPTTMANIVLSARHCIKSNNIYMQHAPQHNPQSISELPKDKVSGQHHIHYTAPEIWGSLSDSEKVKASEAFFLPRDVSTTFMGGVMLWLAALTDELHELIVSTGLCRASNQSGYAKIGKAISVRSKALQNQNATDLRMIFEPDVLVNRVLGDPIWEDEKQNRTNPDLASVPTEKVFAMAYDLFTRSDTSKQKPTKMTWKHFWNNRWQWGASGAVHSQYEKDQQYIRPERELKNKVITLNMIPDVGFDHFALRKPELQAWSSIKYEWGKQRAIYGCDLTNYIMTHFAFSNCEDTLPKDFPVGQKARPSFVTARVSAILAKSTPFCFDFEDFNSQHSTANMQAVLRAWLSANCNSLTEEQIIAGNWATEAIANTIVNDNVGTKSKYKANGTLMSGWRLTTFVNSVLNYVYTNVLLEGYKHPTATIHNGDDVLISAVRPSLLPHMQNRARHYNIRAQASKCAYGGIGEFLRVDHLRGTHGQYLTRSIATLMHARIESSDQSTSVAYLQANENRLDEFIVRSDMNYNLSSRLRIAYNKRMSEITSVPVDHLQAIKISHRVVGGLSDKPLAPVDITVVSEDNRDDEPLISVSELPGVSAYGYSLAKHFEIEGMAGKITKRIYEATLDATTLERKTFSVYRNKDTNQSRVYRGIYRAYSTEQTKLATGKMMLTGIAVDLLTKRDLLSTLAYMTNKARDPIKYLATVL